MNLPMVRTAAPTPAASTPRKAVGMPSKKTHNPIDVHVGSRVRLRRMMLGMSQEKLGEHIGITFQQIQKYEKGTNRIGASRLQVIARVLSVPVAFFFEDAPGLVPVAGDQGFDPGATDHVVDFLSSSEGLSLNKAFIRIKDAKQRRKVVELVKAMAGDEADEIERVNGAALDAYVAAGRAPELNLSNYDADDVAGLNAAMVETWAILDTAFGPQAKG